MNLIHKAKRLYQKWWIKFKRQSVSEQNTVKSTFELEALKICRNLIHCSDVELLVCPDTGRKFIIYDQLQIKVIIEDNRIIISNHTYYYELSVSEYGIKSLTKVFNGNLRNTRDLLEKNIKANAKATLENIVTQTSYLSNN